MHGSKTERIKLVMTHEGVVPRLRFHTAPYYFSRQIKREMLTEGEGFLTRRFATSFPLLSTHISNFFDFFLTLLIVWKH